MYETPSSIQVETDGPSYLGWRGELLAELALARVFSLGVRKDPDESEHDLAVTTERNLRFFVEIRAFSSFRMKVSDVAAVPELLWSVGADHVRRARRSADPVVLFLFDADTDHGRYLRLDTLAPPPRNVRWLTLRFPIEHTITRESVEHLVSELHESARAAS